MSRLAIDKYPGNNGSVATDCCLLGGVGRGPRGPLLHDTKMHTALWDGGWRSDDQDTLASL